MYIYIYIYILFIIFIFKLHDHIIQLCDHIVESYDYMFILQDDYLIAPNFQDAQFSWIDIFKNFAETIFTDRGFR